jgi:hypothetical protein
MQLGRFVRASVPIVILGLGGFVLGCSGQGSPPPDKETGKKIAEERKIGRQEERAAHSQGQGGPVGKDKARSQSVP